MMKLIASILIFIALQVWTGIVSYAQTLDCLFDAGYRHDTLVLQAEVAGIKTTSVTRSQLSASLGLVILCRIKIDSGHTSRINVTSFDYSYIRSGKIIHTGKLCGPYWDNAFKDLVGNSEYDDLLKIYNIRAGLSYIGHRNVIFPKCIVQDIELTLKSPAKPKFDARTIKILSLIRQLPEFKKFGSLYGSDIVIDRSIFITSPYYEADSTTVSTRYKLRNGGEEDYDWTFSIDKSRNGFIIYDNKSKKALTLTEWKNIVRKMR